LAYPIAVSVALFTVLFFLIKVMMKFFDAKFTEFSYTQKEYMNYIQQANEKLLTSVNKNSELLLKFSNSVNQFSKILLKIEVLLNGRTNKNTK